MEDEKKKIVVTMIFSIIAFLNVMFIICFLLFMGFFVGKIDSNKRFIEGMKMGHEKGRYEIYLELERRNYGYYQTNDDTFVFTEKARNK